MVVKKGPPGLGWRLAVHDHVLCDGRLGHLDLPGAGQVTVSGGHAYVGHIPNPQNLGTSIVDIADPAMPAALGSYSTAGWSAGLAVDGRTAYLVAGRELHDAEGDDRHPHVENSAEDDGGVGDRQVEREAVFGEPSRRSRRTIPSSSPSRRSSSRTSRGSCSSPRGVSWS